VLRAFLDGAVFGTTTGEGAPSVLLLHGWRRTHEDFDRVADALESRGVSSVALDLPGFGATPAPAAGMGARGYAAQLAGLVESLASSGEPPVLVGHSFGGRVATCLAASSPSAVAGVVLSGVPLVRASMPRGRASLRYRAVRAAARFGLLSESRLEAARRRYGSADYRAATGVVRDVLVATVGESYEAELAALRCPVALVWGADDTTAPLAVAVAAQRLVPAATLEVLDGVGHLVPTEAPERLAAAALAMLGGAS
jgi:pimeloyl-ACP methyl ester carboxylesterase